MPTTNYQDLQNLWREKENRILQWRGKILSAINELRTLIESRLEAPSETWTEPNSNNQHHYIELIDISQSLNTSQQNTPTLTQLVDSAFSEKGEFFFGLSFTFDHNISTYPKHIRHISIAVRIENNEPQFSFWDIKHHKIAPQSSWTADKDNFIEKIIGKLKDYLSKEQFMAQPHTIGFI